MQPFEIAAGADRQILRIVFRGVVRAESLAAHAQLSAEVIAAMSPGFTAVADLSGLEQMELDCVPHITRLMELFKRAGVGRVFRLIPDADKDIGFTLLSHTHYRGKVPFRTFATALELETALQQLPGRSPPNLQSALR
jgi:hypothetical protein